MAVFFFFFFNDTATTEIYTLSLHDALPILLTMSVAPTGENYRSPEQFLAYWNRVSERISAIPGVEDRKSTRLNSSHSQISYAVFCLKKKKNKKIASLSTPKSLTLVSSDTLL